MKDRFDDERSNGNSYGEKTENAYNGGIEQERNISNFDGESTKREHDSEESYGENNRREIDDERFFGENVEHNNKQNRNRNVDAETHEVEDERFFGANVSERKTGADASERTESQEYNDEVRYGEQSEFDD
ncbi:MAG: hypothetical protein RRY37_03315 [Eubacterium sp.]